MERFEFGPGVAFAPREELLQGASIAPLTQPRAGEHPVQVAVFRIAAGGRITRHPATVGQIFAVIEGAGEVSGEDGAFQSITAGEAVFWESGEQHETRSAGGLTAVIIECAGLLPFRADNVLS